jgi:hypothetical protein
VSVYRETRHLYRETRSDAVHLCQSCRNGTVIKGAAESQEIVHCAVLRGRVRMRVAECSSHYDRTKPDLNDMADTAWVLVTKRAGREIGFIRAAEFRREYRESVVPGT